MNIREALKTVVNEGYEPASENRLRLCRSKTKDNKYEYFVMDFRVNGLKEYSADTLDEAIEIFITKSLDKGENDVEMD